MDKIEIVLLASAAAAYLISFFFSVFRRKEWRPLLTTGLALHTGLIGTRWYLSGHPPVMGTYEACLADAWFTSAVLLYLGTRRAWARGFASFLLLSVLCLMVYGLFFPTGYYPLTISERGLWVEIHALLAYWTWGLYAVAIGAAVLLLSKKSTDTKGGLMDEVLHHFTNLGFLLQSLMMAIGAYYGWLLFGDWWRWDPVESMALVSWLSWAMVLHMRLFYGWKGRRAAWLTLLASLLLLASYKALVFFPSGSTFHVFDLKF